MKKLFVLLLVLGISTVASATTVSLLEPTDLGTKANPMDIGDTLRIFLSVDTGNLGSLGATITSDNGGIIGGIMKADLGAYGATKVTNMVTIPSVGTFPVPAWEGGWEASLSFDTVVTGGTAEIGLGVGSVDPGAVGATTGIGIDPAAYADGAGGPLAYIDVTFVGKDLTLSIANGSQFGGSATQPGTDALTFGEAITVYQVPEPMTMSLLGLGGLALIRRRRA